jgi:hypothetical protein
VDATAGEFVSYRGGGIVVNRFLCSPTILSWRALTSGKGMSQLGALNLAEHGYYSYHQIWRITIPKQALRELSKISAVISVSFESEPHDETAYFF